MGSVNMSSVFLYHLSEAEQRQTTSHCPHHPLQPVHHDQLPPCQPQAQGSSLGRSRSPSCAESRLALQQPDPEDCLRCAAGSPGWRPGMGTRSCGGSRTSPWGTQTARGKRAKLITNFQQMFEEPPCFLSLSSDSI